MQKLFLVRHGESMPAKSGEGDFNRVLSMRGKSDIERLGQLLSGHISKNALILHSSAKRTTETAEILSEKLKIRRMSAEKLYHGTTETYLTEIQLHSEINELLLVGHNPVVTMLANELCGFAPVFSPGSCAELEIKNDGSYYLLRAIDPFDK